MSCPCPGWCYARTSAPSGLAAVAGAAGAIWPTQTAQLFVMLEFVMFVVHPAWVPVPSVIVPRTLPVEAHHTREPAGGGLAQFGVVEYFAESAKEASSAVTMFRRSALIEASTAFSRRA